MNDKSFGIIFYASSFCMAFHVAPEQTMWHNKKVSTKDFHGFKTTNFINSNTVKITIINSMSKSLTFNMAEKSYELRKIHVLFGKLRSFEVYCVQLK